jgi:hypothetical protein
MFKALFKRVVWYVPLLKKVEQKPPFPLLKKVEQNTFGSTFFKG